MKIKSVILTIAIIILTIFVTFYGINTIEPYPEYDNYCNDSIQKQIYDKDECISAGGKWVQYETNYPKPEVTGYCDSDYKCREELNQARELRSKNVFLIALPLGILIIILGSFFFDIETAGAGLMGGGVGTLIYGAGSYWQYSENLMRFVISLIGLSAVIWFSYIIEKKGNKKGKLFSKIFKKK